jgi:serine/threonine-protein kinase
VLALDGDIRFIGADVIVSGDDPVGRMRGDVASAIKQAAGREIEDESISKGPFELGSAWSTGAGHLGPQPRHIIHVAAMDTDMKTKAETVSTATRAALREAESLQVRSIAYPAFGTGVAGFPFVDSGEAMMKGLVQHFSERPSTIEEVVFVLYGKDAMDSFLQGLRKVKAE